MESSFSSIFTPTLKKIAVVNYPAHSPPTSQGRRNCKGQGEIPVDIFRIIGIPLNIFSDYPKIFFQYILMLLPSAYAIVQSGGWCI